MELSHHILNVILPSFSQSLPQDLEFYIEELVKWNKRINLVSRNEVDLSHHFIDSLRFAALPLPNSSVIDIGTGGGFPGMVTALARRDLKVTLYEPNSKKIAFLDRIRTALKVDIEIFNERIEQDVDYGKKWDNAVCRAFTNIEAWESLTTPLADTLWFFASENQLNESSDAWVTRDSWSHESHGNRYLLNLTTK